MRLVATEQGSGSPVVLLHGLFGAGQNFGTVQKTLAAEGYRVLALDLRNHGSSPHAAEVGYAAMAADVAETLAALSAWPASVIGHSMGGKVAMALALARPEGVARLLVADIAPVAYPAPKFAAYLGAMRGLELRPGLTRRQADAALEPAVPAAPLRAFLLQNLSFDPDPPGPPRWRIGLEEIAAGLSDIGGWPDLPGFYEGPTLVLSGDASDYVQPDHWPIFRRLFPAARHETIASGHWLHAENPKAFLDVVRRFLRA
jgi:pimeloyl-ACP methyl ester carboxylesterase